jgi:hypothetical protein
MVNIVGYPMIECLLLEVLLMLFRRVLTPFVLSAFEGAVVIVEVVTVLPQQTVAVVCEVGGAALKKEEKALPAGAGVTRMDTAKLMAFAYAGGTFEGAVADWDLVLN